MWTMCYPLHKEKTNVNEPTIVEESVEVIPDYSRVPIAFEVRSVFEVQLIDQGLGGLTLSERTVDRPWVKDYDSFEDERPARWARLWDISNWGIISAYVDGSRAGGCVIAYDTPGVDMLERRRDIAALWDIRVHPEHRGKRIGSRLLNSAAAWAARRRCRVFKAETQNINVPACRFYAKNGFTLGVINRFAYTELPGEVELVWYKEIQAPPNSPGGISQCQVPKMQP